MEEISYYSVIRVRINKGGYDEKNPLSYFSHRDCGGLLRFRRVAGKAESNSRDAGKSG
jgi:hypothetical protein